MNNGSNRSILRWAWNNSREWQNVQNLIIVGCGIKSRRGWQKFGKRISVLVGLSLFGSP